MDNFNMKQWLQENRVGPYSKTLLNEVDFGDGDSVGKRKYEPLKVGDIVGNTVQGFNFKVLKVKSGGLRYTIEVENIKTGERFETYSGNMYKPFNKSKSVDRVAGIKSEADIQIQEEGDEDWVDNTSMDVVVEGRYRKSTVDLSNYEVSILGKDYVMDITADVDYHVEQPDYEDHYEINPGGIVVDSAEATITKLAIEDEVGYRDVNDPAAIKQIQDLLNTDKRLRSQFEDEIVDYMDFDDYGEEEYYDGLDEGIEGGLTFNELPDCVKENYEKNVTVSVAFVKKDGTVRHIAFRRNLVAYVPSTKPKSDAQLNTLSNNNLMNVYDTNAYIKNLKETGDPAVASKMSFRNFKLDNVLAFMCKGKVFDMRERNQIKDRFGDETYSQLSKNMISALAKDEETGQAVDSELKEMFETVGYVYKTRESDPAKRF